MGTIPRKYFFQVPIEGNGYLIHDYISLQLPHFAPGTVKKMLYNRIVTLNGEIANLNDEIKTGNQIEIKIPDIREYPSSAPKLPILFENKDFLVIDKPAGIPVVAERWTQINVFKQFILKHLEDTEQADCEPRIVHRIDKEASGLVIVAKNVEMERYLSKLFEEHNITKEYIAIVAGVPPTEGRIELKIAQASRHENRMIISEFGKNSITNFKVIEAFRDFSVLQVNIETGRTHQIRVHLASQGYPLAIDPIYGYRTCLKLSDLKQNYRKKGEEKPLAARLTLHAKRLSFILPSLERFEIEAPLHEDMQLLLKMLRKYRGHGSMPCETPAGI